MLAICVGGLLSLLLNFGHKSLPTNGRLKFADDS